MAKIVNKEWARRGGAAWEQGFNHRTKQEELNRDLDQSMPPGAGPPGRSPMSGRWGRHTKTHLAPLAEDTRRSWARVTGSDFCCEKTSIVRRLCELREDQEEGNRKSKGEPSPQFKCVMTVAGAREDPGR